jgi:hypothetical protein
MESCSGRGRANVCTGTLEPAAAAPSRRGPGPGCGPAARRPLRCSFQIRASSVNPSNDISMRPLTVMAMIDNARSPADPAPRERQALEQVADLFRGSKWRIQREGGSAAGPGLLLSRGGHRYALGLKVAVESRRGRLVPLLAAAILESQAFARISSGSRPLAVVMAPRLPGSPTGSSEHCSTMRPGWRRRSRLGSWISKAALTCVGRGSMGWGRSRLARLL